MKKQQLLYIEDDAIDRLWFEKTFSKLSIPWEYTIAKNLKEAINYSHQDFDLIITDANLPDGTYEAVLAAFPHQKIVVASGTPLLKEVSGIDFVLKPFSLQEVLLKIPKKNFIEENLQALASNEAEVQELVMLFTHEITNDINDLKKALADKNIEQIKFVVHRFTSKVRMLNLPCYESCEWIKQHANDTENQDAQAHLKTISEAAHHAIELLQDLIK